MIHSQASTRRLPGSQRACLTRRAGYQTTVAPNESYNIIAFRDKFNQVVDGLLIECETSSQRDRTTDESGFSIATNVSRIVN